MFYLLRIASCEILLEFLVLPIWELDKGYFLNISIQCQLFIIWNYLVSSKYRCGLCHISSIPFIVSKTNDWNYEIWTYVHSSVFWNNILCWLHREHKSSLRLTTVCCICTIIWTVQVKLIFHCFCSYAERSTFWV